MKRLTCLLLLLFLLSGCAKTQPETTTVPSTEPATSAATTTPTTAPTNGPDDRPHYGAGHGTHRTGSKMGSTGWCNRTYG